MKHTCTQDRLPSDHPLKYVLQLWISQVLILCQKLSPFEFLPPTHHPMSVSPPASPLQPPTPTPPYFPEPYTCPWRVLFCQKGWLVFPVWAAFLMLHRMLLGPIYWRWFSNWVQLSCTSMYLSHCSRASSCTTPFILLPTTSFRVSSPTSKRRMWWENMSIILCVFRWVFCLFVYLNHSYVRKSV